MNAIIFGLIGTAVTLFLGKTFLALEYDQLLFSVLIANVLCFSSLIVVLQAEAHPQLKKLLVSIAHAWALFWLVFISGILITCSWMRDVKTMLVLWIPLFFSGAFSALVFGPVQDRIVWARQRRSMHR